MTLRYLDLSYLWLQAAVRGKQVNLKEVQSERNIADLGTKALEKDKVDRHMKNLACVRFDQYSLGLTVEEREGEKEGERTPQYDCVTRSTLPSASTTNPALFH